MKRILLLAVLMFVPVVASRAQQRLVIGERAPELRVDRWPDGGAPAGGAMLVDFFASTNPQCVANLDRLDRINERYGDRLQVILITREDAATTGAHTAGRAFRVGEDTAGRAFEAFGVRFVPFAALIDARGRLVWTGNVASLSNEEIEMVL